VRKITNIISTHESPRYSGVAKFGVRLAAELGCRFYGVEEALELAREGVCGHVLLSTKFQDLDDIDCIKWYRLLEIIDKPELTISIFLHSFHHLDIELKLLSRSRNIFAGNSEILHKCEDLNFYPKQLWCPNLIESGQKVSKKPRIVRPRNFVNLFTFGMAHKVSFARVCQSVEEVSGLGIDFILTVSTSKHEKIEAKQFRNIQSLLTDRFPGQIKFLGFLDDDAIFEKAGEMDAALLLFNPAVRANNTTMYTAMELNLPVICKVDRFSPVWLEDKHNFLNIDKLSKSDFTAPNLERISNNASRIVRSEYSWYRLVQALSIFG
jgi:hypothetical protein